MDIVLGNVVGLLRSVAPPSTKPYVIWGKIINPANPLVVELRIYSGVGDPSLEDNWGVIKSLTDLTTILDNYYQAHLPSIILTGVSGTSIDNPKLQNRDVTAVIVKDRTKNTGFTKDTASTVLNFTDGTVLNNATVTIFLS